MRYRLTVDHRAPLSKATSLMLRVYVTLAVLVSAAIGVEDALRRSTSAYIANCASRTVICTAGSTYYWASALGVAAVALALLVLIGSPIIIAGRIGKRRNRRGYVAGIFFSWAGLLYIIVRKPRTGPDLISRAVSDYRGQPPGPPSGSEGAP